MVLMGYIDSSLIFLVSECIIRIDILSSSQNFLIGSLLYVKKSKWRRSLQTLSNFMAKMLNLKQFCVLSGIVEISVTIKDLKDSRLIFPIR